jgi:hypothetical protein
VTQALHERYTELSADRDASLRRARACAVMTLPATLPPEGHTAQSTLPTTYTSFSGRGATNLASKVTLAMLPPGDSSFQLGVPLKNLVQEGIVSVPPEITKGLAQVEDLVNAKIESLSWRRPTFVTLLHLIVAGNICEYILPDGRIKQFRLDQYVVIRDFAGDELEIVCCEVMKARALPDGLKQRTTKQPNEDCKLYTQFRRIDANTYAVRQDLDDQVVKAEETHNGIMPARALTWNLVPGEDYGRSHVEENYSDVENLDRITQSIRELAAMAARHLTLVRPNAAGGNLRKRIAEARNGAVLSGNADDVETVQFQAAGQLSVLREEKNDLKRDLAAAFMMSADLRRDAERVTATEVRMLVQELETTLGGTYSLLATALQKWRLLKLIAQMRSRGELPDLGKDSIEILVTTGLEALGRDERLNKVRAFFELMGAAGAVQADAALYVKWDEVLTPGATALGFASAVRTDSEVQQLKQQQQQEQLMQQVASAAAGPLATAAAQPPTQ